MLALKIPFREKPVLHGRHGWTKATFEAWSFHSSSPLRYRSPASMEPLFRYKLFKTLVLSSPNRKLKVDPLARQPPIHLGISIQPKVHAPTLLLIQHHLRDLRAVLTGAHALADDLDGVDDIGENGVMHGGQGA